jgi:hypothetical protein
MRQGVLRRIETSRSNRTGDPPVGVSNSDAPRVLLLESGTHIAAEMVRSREPRKLPICGKDWQTQWRRANDLRGNEPIVIKRPIPHFEVLRETNAPLRVAAHILRTLQNIPGCACRPYSKSLGRPQTAPRLTYITVRPS